MDENMDPHEEENSILKEELDRVNGLLENSRLECDDIGAKYKELCEKMEDYLKNHSDDCDVCDDSVTNQLVEGHESLRFKVEQEMSKCRQRISSYQLAHFEQSKLVDDLQKKVEDYSIQCAKLEEALADLSPESPKVIPQLSVQNSSILDLEAALIRLEQERFRCEGLGQVNILLREQLETATEANQALTTDIQHLTEEWQRTRKELDEKEAEWKEDEQSFKNYFTKEHIRLLTLWRQFLNFRHEFARMKTETQRDISFMRTQMGKATQSVTSACLQFLVVHSSDQTNPENNNLNWEIQKLNQEIITSQMKCDREKVFLNERLNDLVAKNDRMLVLLQEKERVNKTLNETIQTMESNIKNKLESSSSLGSNLYHYPEYVNLCHRALMDIMQAVNDDSNHLTWINMKVKGLTHEMSTLPSTSISLQSLPIENRDSSFLPESTVHTVQIVLHKRRLQFEELDLKLCNQKEQIQNQKSLLEESENEKKKLHLLNLHLAKQLENIKQNMDDILKDKDRMKATLDESESQRSWLEEARKALNEQIDSLNVENNRLHKIFQESQQRAEELEEEKEKLQISTSNLTHDLEKSHRLITVLEEKKEILTEEKRRAEETLQEISFDKEVLQQERNNCAQNLSKLEQKIFDYNEELDHLRSEEYTLRSSVESLQTLNESLSQEKKEISKSLSEFTDEMDIVKCKMLKDKKILEEEKNNLKECVEKLRQKCQELETERNILRESLQAVETLKQEVENEKDKISIQNNDLLNQVPKLINQKATLEGELDHARKEFSKLMENNEKISHENDSLAHQKAELLVKVEMADCEFQQLSEAIAILKAEKEDLEKALYDSQQLCSTIREKKDHLEIELKNELSTKVTLQDQLTELKIFKEMEAENSARQKDILNQRIQQIEQEFKMILGNERQQYKVDFEMVLHEKESQLSRLENVQEDLMKKLQKDQEDLINNHEREIADLKKHLFFLEHECEEKLILLLTENKKVQMDLELNISSLQQKVQELENELQVNQCKLHDVEQKSALSTEHHRLLMKELQQENSRLTEDMKTDTNLHETTVKEIKNQMTQLQQQKEAVLEDIANLKVELIDADKENQRLKRELETMSLTSETERHQRELLEEQINDLQHQVFGEKGQTEMTRRSNEEFRNRIKKLQLENTELTRIVEDTKKRLDSMASANNRGKKDISELRSTLHDVEKSRLEAKREIQELYRQKSALNMSLKSKNNELDEMKIILEKTEEKETERRREMGFLKQKVMELEATREASRKEQANLRCKLSDTEHKLRLKQEDYQITLQEGLSVERSLSEHRANLEQSLSDSVQEIQEYRLKFNFSEGRVKALEGQIMKLEESKQMLETKLYNIHLSLRSTLGLGTDSGFMSSSHLLLSPFSSRRASPTKLGDSTGSLNEASPIRDQNSKNTSPTRHIVSWNAMDLDVELIKSALQDMVQKLYVTETEKDAIKNEVMELQRRYDEIKEEYSDKMSKIQHLQRELAELTQSNKSLDEQLLSNKSILLKHENIIQELDREKRILSERNGSLEFTISSLETEKLCLQEKISQLKKTGAKGEEEKRGLVEAREMAESKAVKSDIAVHSHEAENIRLRKALVALGSEVQTLQQKLEDISKKFQSSELTNKSLELTIERLNIASQKYADNEISWKEKVDNLNRSLNETSLSVRSLQDQINNLKREYLLCQQEKSSLKHTVKTLRATVNELRMQNKNLNDHIHIIRRDFRNNELKTVDFESQIKKYQDLISQSQVSEQECVELVKKLEQEKFALQEQVTNLNHSLEEKEEVCSQLEKEKVSLRKNLEKVEKEHKMTGEVANRSVFEKSTLGKTLSAFEMENNELPKQIRTLQAQLSELELRHSQRLAELTKNQKYETKVKIERLETALRQADQIMEAREKTHTQKIFGLEQQVLTLKDHLAQEQRKWQLYQQRSVQASSDIGHLHSILNRSLKNVSEDPMKLSPEAHKLDSTIERELATSPNILLSTPSKLSVSPSNRRPSSTPRAKKRLEPTF